MAEAIKKWAAVIGSIIFHITMVGWFVYLQQRSENNAKWSGGRGDGSYQVAYVDLGAIQVAPATDTTDAVPTDKQAALINPAQKDGLKQRQKLKNKTAEKNFTTATHKSSGKGDSDTPAGGVGNGLDPDGVMAKTVPNTLALIRKKIFKKKTYPLVAKENNITGSVKVSFKIRESGELGFVKVIETSGHSILDDAAVNTVKKSTPLPYYPDVIILRLEYRLE